MGETLRTVYLAGFEEFLRRTPEERLKGFKHLRSVTRVFGIRNAGTIKANRKYRIMVAPGAKWTVLGFTSRNNQEFYHGERHRVGGA